MHFHIVEMTVKPRCHEDGISLKLLVTSRFKTLRIRQGNGLHNESVLKKKDCQEIAFGRMLAALNICTITATPGKKIIVPWNTNKT